MDRGKKREPSWSQVEGEGRHKGGKVALHVALEDIQGGQIQLILEASAGHLVEVVGGKGSPCRGVGGSQRREQGTQGTCVGKGGRQSPSPPSSPPPSSPSSPPAEWMLHQFSG